jgi:two-component system copper resistance phosphate regulon response regulator CusR
MHILVIEDQKKIAQALKEGLQAQSYSTSVASTGEEGFYLLNSEEFDLVILDLMLPGRDGLDILKTIRKTGRYIPVLILTARDTVEDRVLGLEAGADDYLIKPFAFPELLARIKALLRRNVASAATELKIADLKMDLIAHSVSRAGRPLELTAREFSLLEYLLRNQGQVVSREMLTRDVWRETGRAAPLDNVIDVHIARLRKKLDDPFPVKLLKTVRGVGFVLGGAEE